MAIRVELELEDGSFTTRILHAGESLNQFNRNVAGSNRQLQALANSGQLTFRSINQVNESSKGFLATARDLTVVLGAVGLSIGSMVGNIRQLGTSILRVNADFEKMGMLMQSMSTSSNGVQEAAEKVKYLRDMAMQSPFALQTLQKAFVKMEATGTKPLAGGFKALVDGIAAVGGSDEELSRAALAISQMSGKGVIQMEELRQQLGESMPRAVELMARSMGISMGKLIQDIGTGTVEAKSALNAFYLEVDRVYGGSAQRMMTTFNGLVSQTQTLLQLRATDSGGMKAYFQEVKDQLVDLNGLLGSRAGSAIADSIGYGFQGLIRLLRQGIDTALEFSGAIERVGLVLGVAFGARLAVAGIASFITQINAARTSMVAFGAASQVLQSQMQMNQMAYAIGNITNFQNGITRTTMVARNLTGALALTGSVISGLAPWLPLLGLAVMGVAEYFELFSNKANDAWESLERFGASSRRQVEETKPKIDELRQLIAGLEADRAAEMANPGNPADHEEFIRSLDAEIAARKAELETVSGQYRDFYNEAGKNEDNAALQKFTGRLNEQVSEIKRTYDQLSVDRYNAMQEQLKVENLSGSEQAKIRDKYAEDQRQAAVKQYDDQLNLLAGYLDTAKANTLSAMNESMRAQSEGQIKWLLTEIARLQQLKDQSERQAPGVTKVDKPDDPEKAFKKGQQALERIRGDVVNLEAELAGANGEVAELNALMATEKYGDLGREEVIELRNSLVEAIEKKEKLDELLAGKKKLEGDASQALIAAQQKLLEEQYRAAGKTLTEADKVEIRLKNGFYKGFGPGSEAAQSIANINQLFADQKTAAENVASTLQTKTFGDASKGAIDTVNIALRETYSIGQQIASTFAGIDLAQMGNGLIARGGILAGTNAFSTGPIPILDNGIDLSSQVRRGSANFMKGQYGGVGQNIVTISAGGKNWQVNAAAAPYFKGFIDELVAGGYQINGHSGGYAKRNKIGGGGWSQHAYGNAIDINADENPYSKRFQTTLPSNISDLAAKWGLSWGGDWKSMKDTMHFEWTGAKAQASDFKGMVPSIAAAAAQGVKEGVATGTQSKSAGQVQGPVMPATWRNQTVTAKAAGDLNQAQRIEEEANAQKVKNDLLERERTLMGEIEGARVTALDKSAKLAQVTKEIVEGKWGMTDADRDPTNAKYKRMLDLAKQVDAQNETNAQNEKNRAKIEGAEEKLESSRKSLNERLSEAYSRMGDPSELKSSSGFRRMSRELDEYLTKVREVYGADSKAYEEATAQKTQILAQFKNADIADKAAEIAKQNAEFERSMLTAGRGRQAAADAEIASLNRLLQESTAIGEERVLLEATVQKRIAQLRQQVQSESPMGKQMREWADLGGNIEKAMTGWMDSMADGITGLITGTGDLKSAFNGMVNDMVNMGVKYLMSQVMGAKSQVASAGSTGGKKGMSGLASLGGGTKKGMGGLSGAVGLFHGGGMIGSRSRGHKVVDPRIFNGAPRYHTGGLVGGPQFGPGEVPIIAKRGEGVFTPEQMKAMGGNSVQTITIAPSVNVNASGGTPEQNADLARQTSKAVENSVRAIVQQELRSVMRPGNIMGR